MFKSKIITGVLFMSILTFLTSCAPRINGSKYLTLDPPFKLEEYFNGPVKAWGIIQNRKGDVISRFDAEMLGRWEGNEGVLEEVFTYYDTGKTQNRTWKITKIDALNYEGRAGDIIGKAKGKSYGNAIYWTYKMDVPVKDKSYRLTFHDWIWAMKDGVIINRAYLKKFGITVAQITIFMKKPDHD